MSREGQARSREGQEGRCFFWEWDVGKEVY